MKGCTIDDETVHKMSRVRSCIFKRLTQQHPDSTQVGVAALAGALFLVNIARHYLLQTDQCLGKSRKQAERSKRSQHSERQRAAPKQVQSAKGGRGRVGVLSRSSARARMRLPAPRGAYEHVCTFDVVPWCCFVLEGL